MKAFVIVFLVVFLVCLLIDICLYATDATIEYGCLGLGEAKYRDLPRNYADFFLYTISFSLFMAAPFTGCQIED